MRGAVSGGAQTIPDARRGQSGWRARFSRTGRGLETGASRLARITASDVGRRLGGSWGRRAARTALRLVGGKRERGAVVGATERAVGRDSGQGAVGSIRGGGKRISRLRTVTGIVLDGINGVTGLHNDARPGGISERGFGNGGFRGRGGCGGGQGATRKNDLWGAARLNSFGMIYRIQSEYSSQGTGGRASTSIRRTRVLKRSER
ncbi:hypothetical protein Tco_0437827 [Tanacetum coccineum]